MSEMVERVANALRRTHAKLNIMDPLMDVDPDEMARAAIEAMREPTKRMIEEGSEAVPAEVSDGPAERIAAGAWTRMIDEALK